MNLNQRLKIKHFGIGMALASVVCLPLLLCGDPASAQKNGKLPAKPPVKKIVAMAPEVMSPIKSPMLLAYRYKEGSSQRYKIRAYLNGRIPPFATDPTSAPTHILIEFDYVATVKSVSEKGALVEFAVPEAELSLLENEPPADFKVPKKEITPLEGLVSLGEIQKIFNCTAVLRPDGTVAEVKGGNDSKVKVNIGIDLRKLFLVTAPVAFPETAVKPGETWSPTDGLLGNLPSRTLYSAKVETAQSGPKTTLATLSETSESSIYDNLDREGNSTPNKDAQVGTLKGEAKLKGAFRFRATQTSKPATGAISAPYSGMIEDGRLDLTVNMDRVMPDPDKPGAKLTLPIDVRATFFVKAIETPAPKKK